MQMASISKKISDNDTKVSKEVVSDAEMSDIEIEGHLPENLTHYKVRGVNYTITCNMPIFRHIILCSEIKGDNVDDGILALAQNHQTETEKLARSIRRATIGCMVLVFCIITTLAL
jgi:hypothetical protein